MAGDDGPLLGPGDDDSICFDAVRQVAGALGINLGITYELIRRGEIPAKRVGRRWLIPRDAFHAWLHELEAA